ncbi:MAG: DUF4271 domain-containing protein [Flavobacteriales bacterium]|jgi:hypothetical protein|nr:DUF4271 domain-containing protein [Flavobacteriales bacterium]MCB0757626.1 DUF4271 domain-containing protein [Flavobacteriales bacterium]
MDELRAVDALGSGWLAGILGLAFGVLAWVQMVSPRQWVVLARSFGALRLGRHRLREELDMRDRTLTGLAVLSAVVIAMFAYQVLLYHHWILPGMLGFLRILLVVAAVVLAQVVLLLAIRQLPAEDGGQEEYLYTLIVFHVVLGLLLLPVVTVMSFPGRVAWREWIWLVGLAIVAATVMFRWVRAVVVGVSNGTPLRYIFLYLCALEILPVALALEQARNFVPPLHHP